MSKPVPYATLHLTIDGAIFDRDRGSPDVELELEPMGTALPRDEQSRELTIRIGRTKATLDEEGIVALKEFLDMRP